MIFIACAYVMELYELGFYKDKDIRRDAEEGKIAEGEYLVLFSNQVRKSRIKIGLHLFTFLLVLFLSLTKYHYPQWNW